MTPRRILCLAASATASGCLALGFVEPARANLVLNGGFESNSINGIYGSSFVNGTQAVTLDGGMLPTVIHSFPPTPPP
jgi:hypothetical protein